MARFRGGVQGSRQTATRLGHRSIKTFANGWNVGVRVFGHINEENQDEFLIEATGGSQGSSSSVSIAKVKLTDKGIEIVNLLKK